MGLAGEQIFPASFVRSDPVKYSLCQASPFGLTKQLFCYITQKEDRLNDMAEKDTYTPSDRTLQDSPSYLDGLLDVSGR